MSGIKYENGFYRIVETPTKVNDSNWFSTYTLYVRIDGWDNAWLLVRAGYDTFEDALEAMER